MHYRHIGLKFFLLWMLCFIVPVANSTDMPTISPYSALNSQPADLAKLKQNLASIGMSFKQEGNNVDITIDEKKALEAIPTLEAENVIPKLNASEIEDAPVFITVSLVGISFTAVIIHSLYELYPALDKIQVQTFLLPDNNQHKQLCYFFAYNRNVYKRLDLNLMTTRDFILHSPTFTFSDWCRNKMDKEARD